ncbi:Negative regulator of mitotic exit, partial [Tulasnella sp. UAMH 9824]
MSAIRWKWPFKLPKSGRSSSSSSTFDIHRQGASDTSPKDIAPLGGAVTTNVNTSQVESVPDPPKESTTGSLTIHSRTGPDVASDGGIGSNASEPQAGDTMKVGTIELKDPLFQGPHTNAAIKSGHPEQGTRPDDRDVNSKSGLDLRSMSSSVPHALTWTQYTMELRPVMSLKSSGHSAMTSDVFPRNHHSCTGIPNFAGEFIIFGGEIRPLDEKAPTNDVILLSTTDKSLTSLETNGATPTPRSGHRAIISGRVLIVFGGHLDDRYLYFLNLDTREWSKLRPPAPYPSPRFGHSFTIVDNTIWLFGGSLINDVMDDMWYIDLKTENIQYLRWQHVPKKETWPQPRSYHSMVYYGGCLYMFAGALSLDQEPQTFINDLWKFDIHTQTWTKVQCNGLLPQPRASPNTTVIGDNMFIFGGLILEGQPSQYNPADDAFVFNFKDDTWRSLAMLGLAPPPTREGVLLTLDSQLVLVGGQPDNDKTIHFAESRA